jgi:hypothetical protein
MSFLIRTSLIVVLATAGACAGRSPETAAQPTDSAAVQVRNQGFSDMVVYVINGGQRIRLGLVTGNSTNTFTIPRHLIRGAGGIQFLADPVGGSRTPVSEEMTVNPGDVVTLTIPPQ